MRLKVLLIILGVVVIAFGVVFYFYGPYSEAARGGRKPKPSPSPSPISTLSTSPTIGISPSPVADLGTLYGVTVDDTSGISDTLTAISKLPQKMTVRIVFDRGMAPSDYQNAVNKIDAVAYTMAEPVDSSDMRRYSLDQYKSRFSDYLAAYKDKIDIWEVGNEVNGEWLGSSADVSAKIAAAYDIVKAAGKTTALTLHFNEGADCPTYPQNEMYSWVNTYVPATMKQGLDYILFSYYPENCPEIKPDWNAEFTKTGNIFPNSKLGYGEIGMNGGTDAQKAALVNEFYQKQISHPRYVRGVFWWYFREEMVPYTQYLWGVLNTAISD